MDKVEEVSAMPWFHKSDEDLYLDQCEAEVLEVIRHRERLEADIVKFIKANFSTRGRLELVGGAFYASYWACGSVFEETPDQIFQKLLKLADGNTALAEEVVRRCRERIAPLPDIDEKFRLVVKVRGKVIDTFSSGEPYWRHA